MSVEQDYIDIYTKFSGQMKTAASTVAASQRDAAFERFCKVGFPTSRLEDYQHSNIQQCYATNYGINLNQFKVAFNPYHTFKCDVQTIKSYLLFVVNDVFFDASPEAVRCIEALKQKGVCACSLRKAEHLYPEVLRKYYGQAVSTDDGLIDFNTAFALDGLFLYVPKGVVLDTPVQVINVMNGDADSLANSRNLIVVDEGARLQLLSCTHSSKQVKYLANRVTETFVEAGASFENYRLEDSSDTMVNLESDFIRQQADSHVWVNNFTLHNGFTRNNVQVDLLAPGAEVDLYAMAVVDGTKHIDNHTFVRHAAPHCTCNELYKYLLDDESVGSFDGKILVEPGAQKTSAYQSNKNIVMTNKAKMFTKPQLIINADDVKCSHGAAVGQLDESALFYMRQRGISLREARMLLMLAFCNDVIEKISIDVLRQRISLLFERRLRGENYQCSSCGSCKS